ncbi:bZIP transcription factor [Aspergillus saccharolyticus JOP 1030-1]|uniref:BZIP domain-containing protein n=1 Tax=Aspergillus saccharolyticus JOP 1030-1 TaxID=1450539 RepID=A0A318ZYK3_9EURO|nr:hypothetical protein BP01DRAFT_332328 [Aspergillus saccharolyticus JOP 1030-1]PYH49383.1 hypothetical protein BP01DRAFT_332328 [Aspergillus saccharolyticus JOP 1030-1]
MATLAEHPAVPSTYEQDIETFLDLDQLAYTTAENARSKTALITQPTLPSTEFNAGDVRSAGFASTNPTPVAYQAPSHQYDEHKQQTGLPPGALAHAMTFNHMNGMGFGGASPNYPMNGDMYAGAQLKREDAPMDFNSPPTRNPSEMDLESDGMGTASAYFLSPNPSNRNQFVDPNALSGHEVVPAGPSTQVGRMYPGMHQQQAAMAKAAQQQRHHEFLRQQQFQQQQRRLEEHMHGHGAPHSQTPRPPNPLVEERISRLLQQMRQNAMGSPDDSPSPSSSLPQMAKAKKDEQDMDEDERLLASEEGKKLSSKERRQLRNKVSARAFRSRRKEYIGQLESEVAAKTTEAHELRLQNRALFEENGRLTDLVRTLLSSPHFGQVLDELSVGGVPISSQAQQQQHSQHQHQPQPQPQPQQQLAHPQPQQQQQQPPIMSQPPMQQPPQASMVMVPNQGLDGSAMALNNGGWNSGIDMNFGNASVFAVLEVPEPTIDSEALSGKSSTLVESYFPNFSGAKSEASILKSLPLTAKEPTVVGIENPDVEIDESDPAFALFLDQPSASATSKSPATSVEDLSEKTTFELVLENQPQECHARFAQLCHSMEAAFERVSLMTSHLS